MVNCLVRRVAVPEVVLKWTKFAREYESIEQIMASEFAEIYANFCSLHASINAGRDPPTVVSAALNIDSELARWEAKYVEEDLYATILVEERTPEVLSDHWHHYRDFETATEWNHWRSLRILVNEIILTHLSSLRDQLSPLDSAFPFPSPYDGQIEASKRLIHQLSHKICASAPYFLGSDHGSYSKGWGSSYGIQSAAKGKRLLWPLYVAGQTDFVSDVMRRWICGRLEMMADEMGVQKSRFLAKLLRTKERTPEWKSKSKKVWRELPYEEM
jgi:hypothetical protein